MELVPDTLLNNRYRIIRPLGQGGMGAVYLAVDTSLEHQVAVKSNRNPSQQSTTQFIREARLLATIHHPNLPRVMDYFIIDEIQYLVMDYIPGEDLGKLMETDQPQPLDTVLEWAEQLGSAVSYLHAQNPPVIHRDIKPANIKLTPDGQIVLVDFGIAKATDVSQATATGASGYYTPGFAPPEQYGGHRTGSYSDQYALAATFYTLLSGTKPVDSVQRVIGSAVLTPLAQLNPIIPVRIQNVIERALALRPEDRFVSVDEFINTLVDPSFKPTLPAPRVQADTTLKSVQTNRSRRGWGIFAGIAVLVLVFLLAVVGFIIFRGRITARPAVGEVPHPTIPQAVLPLEVTNTLPQINTSIVPNVTLQPPTVQVQIPTETLIPPTSVPEPTETFQPIPLASGGIVAFSSDREDGKTVQIWMMQIAQDNSGKAIINNLNQLTSGAGDKKQPEWSPDGTKLIYSGDSGDNTTKIDLYVLDMNSPDNPPAHLTEMKGDETDPVFSPDGKMIAFTYTSTFTNLQQVYVMNSDGSNLLRVSQDLVEFSPFWSEPGMDWLMNIGMVNGHQYLWRRKWQGVDYYSTGVPKPKPYDITSLYGRLGEVADPVMSPNGNLIAYTKIKRNSRQLCTVDFQSQGAKINILSGTSQSDYEPDWSPDTKWIVFTSERDGYPEVYIMTVGGQMQTNLTNRSEGKDMQPAWKP